ncbi:MAG: tripartite tricarboxylate transporter substrate binding protein [Burkholderiaceae bacterium]|nr:tripartite tricarboxylate transporter substrate binding protein [Burkholderiaceae bacterium]
MNTMRVRRCLALCLAGSPVLLAALATPGRAQAQDFPSRPITITVGYGPGDNMDLMMRLLASKAEKALGQSIQIVNRPGAAGGVALTALAKDRPDGHQLAAVLDTALVRLPQLRRMAYKAEDFAPVLQFAVGVTGVVVKADAPWKSLPEMIDWARAHPGQLTYTTTGPGTTMHIGFQYIEQQARIQWTHVPYPAAKQGLAAVQGGHVLAAVGSTQWVPDVRDGRMRLLAVLSEQRMKAFPEVPTLRDLGIDYAASSGAIVVAPRDTPAPVLARLNAAFAKAMADPDYLQLLQNLHHEPAYRPAEELRRQLEATAKDFARLIVALKIPTEFDAR